MLMDMFATRKRNMALRTLRGLLVLCGLVFHAAFLYPHSSTEESLLIEAQRRSDQGDLLAAQASLDSALAIAIGSGDTTRIADVLTLCGLNQQKRGDYNAALRSFYRVMALLEAQGDDQRLSEVYNNIGSIHHYQREFEQARTYYTRGLQIAERIGSPRDMGKFHNNFGSLAEDMGEPAAALEHLRNSLTIWQELDDHTWMAVCYANMGSCHDRMEQHDTARAYLQQSLALLKNFPDRYLMGTVSTRLGVTYLAEGPWSKARDWCERGLAVAMEMGVLPLEEASCDCLYKAHAALGNTMLELTYFRRAVELRDSLYSKRQAMELTRAELNHQFERQLLADSLTRAQEKLLLEKEHSQRVAKEREQRNVFLFSSIGVLVLAGGLWNRLRFIRRSRALIQGERDRADALLHNILPVAVADELLATGHVKAREFEQATILFTDFREFTRVAERLTAAQLVEVIDTCFKAFDGIMEKHRVEKIKTVGDAYMACGGVPDASRGNAIDVVLAALEMQEFMQVFQEAREAEDLPAFAMRSGIHTGPIVGGVVGSHKFAFDIWGDAVNTAARLESSSEVDRVNISESTYQLVCRDPRLHFTFRGLVSTKGKGEMPMYYVERSEPKE